MNDFNLFNYNSEKFENYQIFLEKIKNNPDLFISGKRCAYITLYLLFSLNISFTINELYDIYYGSIIHDIGKTKIANTILNKNSSLNDEEKIIMKNHTELGNKILFPYIESKIITDIVSLHHEKLDGSGYNGLVENEIPIYVQALEIADMYDAMTNIRPYRNSLSRKDTLDILSKDALNKKINKDMVLILSDDSFNLDGFRKFIYLLF